MSFTQDRLVSSSSISPASARGHSEMPSQALPSQACDPWNSSAGQLFCRDPIPAPPSGPHPFEMAASGTAGLRAGNDNFLPLAAPSLGPSQPPRMAGNPLSSAENRSKRKALMLEKQRDRLRPKKTRVGGGRPPLSNVSSYGAARRFPPPPAHSPADMNFEMMANGFTSTAAKPQLSAQTALPWRSNFHGFSTEHVAGMPWSNRKIDASAFLSDGRDGLQMYRYEQPSFQGRRDDEGGVRLRLIQNGDGSVHASELDSAAAIDFARRFDQHGKNWADFRTEASRPDVGPFWRTSAEETAGNGVERTAGRDDSSSVRTAHGHAGAKFWVETENGNHANFGARPREGTGVAHADEENRFEDRAVIEKNSGEDGKDRAFGQVQQKRHSGWGDAGAPPEEPREDEDIGGGRFAGLAEIAQVAACEKCSACSRGSSLCKTCNARDEVVIGGETDRVEKEGIHSEGGGRDVGHDFQDGMGSSGARHETLSPSPLANSIENSCGATSSGSSREAANAVGKADIGTLSFALVAVSDHTGNGRRDVDNTARSDIGHEIFSADQLSKALKGADQSNVSRSPRKESAPGTPEKCDIVDQPDLRVVKQEIPSTLVLATPRTAVDKLGDAPPEAELKLPFEHVELSPDKASNRVARLILKEEQAQEQENGPGKNEQTGLVRDTRANGLLLPCKRSKETDSAAESAAPEQKKGCPSLDLLVDALEKASGSSFACEKLETDVKCPADEPNDRFFSTASEPNINEHEGKDVKVVKREISSLGGEFSFCQKKVLRRARSRYKRTAGGSGELSGATEGSSICTVDRCNSYERDQMDVSGSQSSLAIGRAGSSPAQEVAKEAGPLIRSTRGRAQALPGWLRDSVVATVKKGTKVDKKPSDGQEAVAAGDPGSEDVPSTKETDAADQKHGGAPSPSSQSTMFPAEKQEAQVPQAATSSELVNAGLNSGASARKARFSPSAQQAQQPSDMESPPDGDAKGSPIPYSLSGGLHPLEEFDLGDIVWAKSGKRNDPVWPARVVDPIKDAPEIVRAVCIPNRLCVMFFGPSVTKKGQRDYGWVKQGMIFPYFEYMAKFTRQTHFNRSKPADFRCACEEALLADAGFEDCQGLVGKRHYSTWGDLKPQSDEKDGSCDAEGLVGPARPETLTENSQNEVVLGVGKSAKICAGCGVKLPAKKPKTGASEDGTLCRQCVKLYKSRQYCGVCKKVWLPNEKGNWAMCDKCQIWIHADCDKITNKSLKELENGRSYTCPDCRKSHEVPQPRKERMEVPPLAKMVVPEFIEVICSGMLGDYQPNIHEIICKCDACGSDKRSMRPSEWEKHTGCRKKKWKESIKLKTVGKPLLHWLKSMRDGGAMGLAYNGPEVWAPQLRHEELAACLQVPYEPIVTTWTSERCGICRWVEDYDYNKMIICIRCQVAVHEECYGVQASRINTSSWVCRACETPETERQCCLCPVRGGALKPTTTQDLWIHVTCAWFMQEVTFPDASVMEPAEGVTSIPLARFREVCAVCKQVHGACAHCAKCRTPYHTMCAFRAGYHMEVQSVNNKSGVPMTRMVSYCAKHKEPNPDMSLVLRSAEGMLAAEPRHQPNLRPTESLSLLATNAASATIEVAPAEIVKTSVSSSAARCQPYSPQDKASKFEETRGKGIPYRVAGCSWNEIEHINSLREFDELNHGAVMHIEKRVSFLQKTEQTRVTFGKSGIHGWGLFARRTIREGETVLEYRGERVRRIIADLREKRYNSQGKDCYLFKVSDDDDLVIDATEKGNIGRLINHSCAPNCFAKIWEVRKENGKDAHHIMLIARQDVSAGDELTYNYRFAPEDEKKVVCLCGAPTCTRWLN